MALTLPSQQIINRAVELASLHGSDDPAAAVERVVARLEDRLARMKQANELLRKWRPNQAAPALERIFPLATVRRLVTPNDDGSFGFTDAELTSLMETIATLSGKPGL